jgi:superfamily II DNA or RNA helicase
MRPTITLLDFVNAHLSGFSRSELKYLIKKTSVKDPSAFQMATYRAGMWDGNIPFIDEEGFTYVVLVDRIVSIMDETYNKSVDIIDERPHVDTSNITIDENFLLQETGKTLRDYQVETVNLTFQHQRGIAQLATNAGKTLICMAISKAADHLMRSVVIVPSELLLNQTYEDYKKSDLSVLKLTPKIAPKNRCSEVLGHRHIIVTETMFTNAIDCFSSVNEPFILIKDETHRFGDVLAEALRFDMPNAPIRLGLTGTMPTCKLKSTKIKCHLGGDVLKKVMPKHLIDMKTSDEPRITMIKTLDSEVSSLMDEYVAMGAYDWSMEQKYLLDNKARVKEIGDFILSLPKTNTLVLCAAAFGVELGTYMNLPFIYEETSVDNRAKLFDTFNHSQTDALVLASYGTASTGISVNDIFRIVLVDVGKNEAQVIQSIGRGIRKSTHQSHVDIVDIYAGDFKYSIKHKQERVKLYKKYQYEFIESDEVIKIKHV